VKAHNQVLIVQQGAAHQMTTLINSTVLACSKPEAKNALA